MPCDQIWMTDLLHLRQRNINARLLKLLYHFVQQIPDVCMLDFRIHWRGVDS